MVSKRRSAADARDVLELRVHGVNNTTPAAMLDLKPDEIEEVLGDELASFWRPKRPEGADRPKDRGRVPPGITREAYSWGGLARTSPGGGQGTVGKVVSVLATIGWALLLPFGLANIGYWSRRLEYGDPPSRRRGRPGRYGAGASMVRLFGLGLTAFVVVTVSAVSLDLVGTQCFVEQGKVCARLPGAFDGLARLEPGARLAVLSLVPVALLTGLWVLSSISRSRYERAFSQPPKTRATSPQKTSETRGTALLARPTMWSGDPMVAGLAHVHLAVGFAVVALALAWPAVFSGGSACAEPVDLLRGACWTQVGDDAARAVVFGGCLTAVAVVLLASVWTTVRRSNDAPDVAEQRRERGAGAAWLPLALAILTLLATQVAMVVADLFVDSDGELLAETGEPLMGVSAFPTVLLAVLLGFVAAGLLLRFTRRGLVWGALLSGSVLALAFTTWAALALVLALVLVLAELLAAGRRGGKRRWQAWSGTAPGMFLGAATQAQMLVASFFVLGAGDWLNGSNGAKTLVPGFAPAVDAPAPTSGDCVRLCSVPDPVLTVPLPYVLLAASLLLTVLLTAVVVLTAATHWRNPGSDDEEDGPDVSSGEADTRRARRQARAFARVAHRAEKVFGVLVALSVLTTLGVVATSAGGWLDVAGAEERWWARALNWSTPAVSFVGLALLGALVKGATSGSRRPFGLVWDLVAFLPRAAHPFAPPCYAERAVPELTQRIGWWLDDSEADGEGQRRGKRVVVSAHSLGGVVTVAALMDPSLAEHEQRQRIRLLTYGSQLRAYFSRIFPELLGPEVLGVPPARAASLFARDPWAAERRSKPRYDGPMADSLLDRLGGGPGDGPLWRNLWRNTDYLGFPVWSYGDGPVPWRNALDNRKADRIDRTGYLLAVLTHGNYPRTKQYTEELIRLAGTPEDEVPAAPRGGLRRRRTGR